MIDGMKSAVPIGSNFLKISHGVLVLRSGEERPIERGRKNVTITRATAPIGRLTKFRKLQIPSKQASRSRERICNFQANSDYLL